MIKQRILGLALSLALLGTFGLALTARAADNASFTVDATVTDTLVVSISTTNIKFAHDPGMDFLGSRAVYGSCADVNGAVYFGPHGESGGGGVIVNVKSNNTYSLTRGLDNTSMAGFRVNTNPGTFDPNLGCEGQRTHSVVVPASDAIVSSAAATDGNGTNYDDFFLYEVKTTDSAAPQSGTITYTASAS